MRNLAEKSIALAEKLLIEAKKEETSSEKRERKLLAAMMKDLVGKPFVTALTDQCFRSASPERIAEQVRSVIQQYGIPRFFPWPQKIGLWLFKWIGAPLVPLLKHMIRLETAKVIVPGEKRALEKHLQKRRQEGVKVNLNHLGEAVLGEEEAKKRLEVYLDDLTHPDIDYISVKMSTLYSQIHLLGWKETVAVLKERLQKLYRTGKFINLDMEEYRDLHLTVDVFCQTLDDPEFFHTTAGIVLQAYLPDSFPIQQQLTAWAIKRVALGGAPIKIRLVKGANLAMEQVEASLKEWSQAPYLHKEETDANFKKMLLFGLEQAHAKAVRIGVGSHNLFDIALAILVTNENQVAPFVTFEMLEGMADPIRRVVQRHVREVLLYCPVATESEFQNAVAYLMRRLDENTAPDNFLRHLFEMEPHSAAWYDQASRFQYALEKQDQVSHTPRRLFTTSHQGEPDTDWTLEKNRKWGLALLQDPHFHVEHSLGGTVAHQFRKRRPELIRAMVENCFKTVYEADVEVSEAIDFCEFYARNREEWDACEGISWKPKGSLLVAPPWNFPCSIPAGGVAAALITGNQVIFKPAPEAKQVGQLVAEMFWDAGISHNQLQLIDCPDEPEGSDWIRNPLIQGVILTGATSTAKTFLNLRPGLDLMAETGGKGSLIVTAMADRDLAIRDTIHSAFSHAGQKCSALTLLILEKEVYDDPHFRQQLRDAAASLKVGSPWDPSVRVNPLIRLPNQALLRGLTTLDPGETWLLKPIQIHETLWTPGIKWGVQAGSFMHQTELFGPLLAVMWAENLSHAITLANGTPYGLTAGIHTLDRREVALWEQHMEAGNLYVNRTITGAIVKRQPFGGCKASSFGPGLKAGGPNYLVQLMIPTETRTEEDYADAFQRYFAHPTITVPLLGEHNTFKYVPRRSMVTWSENPHDLALIQKAAAICQTPLEIIRGPEEHLIERILFEEGGRLRLPYPPSPSVTQVLASRAWHVHTGPPLRTGRLELLHYLREVVISDSYHRYGFIFDKWYK